MVVMFTYTRLFLLFIYIPNPCILFGLRSAKLTFYVVCSLFGRLQRCSYGDRCCFIHSDEKKKKSTSQRRKKSHHKSHRKKGSNRTKHDNAPNDSKDARRGVTRLQQRNIRNREMELEASQPPPAAKQYDSLHLISPWSPTISASVSKSPPPVSVSKSPPPAGAEPKVEWLPNIRSTSPSVYQNRKESKPQDFMSKDSLDHVKAILAGVGINPVVANATDNLYSFKAKAIDEVAEDPYGISLMVADPYRPKGNLSPVHPERSTAAESPEADGSWDDSNSGRLSVFKSIRNKSRSCRW